jgi:hypothetical protein
LLFRNTRFSRRTRFARPTRLVRTSRSSWTARREWSGRAQLVNLATRSPVYLDKMEEEASVDTMDYLDFLDSKGRKVHRTLASYAICLASMVFLEWKDCRDCLVRMHG